MSVHRKELRGAPKHGALGHGLFGLCVSPSLVRIRLRRLVGIRLVKVYFWLLSAKLHLLWRLG